MLFKRFISIYFCLFFLTGCSKNPAKLKKEFLEDISFLEAKLTDIPLPLNVEPILPGISSNSYAFSSKDALKNIIHFYEIEMELLGWKKKSIFAGFESLLIFEKPNKQCIISIRSNKKLTNIFIFLTS